MISLTVKRNCRKAWSGTRADREQARHELREKTTPEQGIIFQSRRGVLPGQPFWTSSGLFNVTHWVRGRRPSAVFASCLINLLFVPSSFATEKETRLALLKKQAKKKKFKYNWISLLPMRYNTASVQEQGGLSTSIQSAAPQHSRHLNNNKKLLTEIEIPPQEFFESITLNSEYSI